MNENTETTGAPPHIAEQIVDMVNSGLISVKQGRELLAGPIAQPPAPRTQKLLACEHCKAMQKVQPATDAVMCATCYAAGHSLRALTSLPPAAAHVERRAGQRWVDPMGVQYVIVDATPGAEIGVVNGRLRVPLGTIWQTDAHWAKHGRLLADAPPEPATVRCAQHGAVASLCIQCKALGKSPPAQEAPKAAPVCTNGRLCKTPIAYVFERVLRDERQFMCDFCYLDYEFNLSKMMRGESTGTPYAGPTRLPRPQLAADWFEDCLPTVWR